MFVTSSPRGLVCTLNPKWRSAKSLPVTTGKRHLHFVHFSHLEEARQFAPRDRATAAHKEAGHI